MIDLYQNDFNEGQVTEKQNETMNLNTDKNLKDKEFSHLNGIEMNTSRKTRSKGQQQ